MFLLIAVEDNIQKQPIASVLQNRCPWKVCNIDRKTTVEVSDNFIRRRPKLRCFPVANLRRTPLSMNICVRLLLKWLYEVIVWNIISGQSLSKPSWNNPLSNQNFKHNSARMPSLHLTLRFLLSLGFLCSLLTVAAEKANACSPWTPCYFLLWLQACAILK